MQKKLIFSNGNGSVFIINHDQLLVTKYEEGKKTYIPGDKIPELFKAKGHVYSVETIYPVSEDKFIKVFISTDDVKRLYSEIVAIEKTETEEEFGVD